MLLLLLLLLLLCSVLPLVQEGLVCSVLIARGLGKRMVVALLEGVMVWMVVIVGMAWSMVWRMVCIDKMHGLMLL